KRLIQHADRYNTTRSSWLPIIQFAATASMAVPSTVACDRLRRSWTLWPRTRSRWLRKSEDRLGPDPAPLRVSGTARWCDPAVRGEDMWCTGLRGQVAWADHLRITWLTVVLAFYYLDHDLPSSAERRGQDGGISADLHLVRPQRRRTRRYAGRGS